MYKGYHLSSYLKINLKYKNKKYKKVNWLTSVTSKTFKHNYY